MSYAGKNIKRRNKSAVSRRVPSKLAFILVLIISVFIFINLTVVNTTAAPGSETGNRNKYYTSIKIEQGDSLWNIADKYCTSEYSDYYAYINEVKIINNMATDNIKSGDSICIPYYAESPLV